MTYAELEIALADWAQTRPDIRAILVIGSRARGGADRWSDLDLLIFTTNPAPYAADPAWVDHFGERWVTYLEMTSANDPEWYVVFAGGLKMDAVLMRVEDASLDLDTLLKPYQHWHALMRGAAVLFDRLGVPRLLPTAPFEPAPAPSSSTFENVVMGFLMAAATTAKFTARGDFWRAQHWFAQDLRPHLLRMIEWHAYGKETWYSGRFIDQWADPRALAALPDAFPAYERASLQAALLALLDLFRWLGEESAARFGFTYPAEAHDKIAALAAAILTERA